MIYKDGEITVIEFGTGDIDITAGFIDDPAVTAGVVSFSQGVPGEIGSRHNSNGDYGCDDISGYVNEHTRFVFYNTQSIDVVIELLFKAKKHMLE
jgi:hypothetical protein